MNATVSIELTHMAASGEAVGRDEAGRVVLVSDAIPGERVEVEIVAEASGGGRRGVLRRVLRASPDRIEAACPHFGPSQPILIDRPEGEWAGNDLSERSVGGEVFNPSWRRAGCGGCRWQQIDYERQLALKREIVVDILARDGRGGATARRSRELAERMVAEVIALGAGVDGSTGDAAALDFGFRTQMRFGVAESGRLTLAGRNGEGLAVDACALHHPQLAELFAGWRVDGDGADREAGGESEGASSMSAVTLAVGGTADSLSDGARGVLILHSDRDDPPGLELDLPVNVFLLHKGREPFLELLVGDWSYSVQGADGRLTAYPPVGAAAGGGHLLADEVLAAVAADLLELQTFEHLLELWAGIGARATVLAERVATIVAVEEAELASAALRSNLAGLDNVDAWHGETLPTVRKLRRGAYRFDAALVTPPGGVVEPALFSLLTRMRVRRCGVITEDARGLARGLGEIDEAGYRLVGAQPIDLQPHQPGVTLVARFDRK